MDMEELMKDADWKTLRELHPGIRDRFCQRHLDHVSKMINTTKVGAYQRYQDITALMKSFQNLMNLFFADFKRSDGLMKLAGMREAKLVTDEEYALFSAEARAWVEEFLTLGPSKEELQQEVMAARKAADRK
ncbi:MAG: hypothetical protein HOP19_17585 [Acidobacteria bacterium]|nr:hypothetical protein [Acidobacteriota bacterium]